MVDPSPSMARAALQFRVARHTERLDAVVAFYREGIGLREIASFRGHAGYDGVFLEVPETGAHLEFTAGGGHGAPVAHPESLLVFYLGDEEAVRRVAARLGADPVAPANPYWAEHALTFEDPDGFRVVLVQEPWLLAAEAPEVEGSASSPEGGGHGRRAARGPFDARAPRDQACLDLRIE